MERRIATSTRLAAEDINPIGLSINLPEDFGRPAPVIGTFDESPMFLRAHSGWFS